MAGFGQRQIIFLVLAAFVGIGMVLLARGLLSGNEKTAATAPQAAPLTQVLVAARDIPSGGFINKPDGEWRSWPADSPTEGLFVQGATSEKDYVGAVLREGVRKGEPILRARLTKPNDGGFLSAVLAPGMRALTIKVTPTSGVAGLIYPNDRVDVILTQRLTSDSDNGQSGERRVSETALENVRVLALDQKTDDQKKEPKVAELATLEVSSKQAEKLALIAQMGQLSLALRSVAKEIPIDLGGVTPTEIPAVDAAPLTMDNEVSKIHRVQIIRGSTSSEVVVPGGGN